MRRSMRRQVHILTCRPGIRRVRRLMFMQAETAKNEIRQEGEGKYDHRNETRRKGV